MSQPTLALGEMIVIPKGELNSILESLTLAGYSLIGPRKGEEIISYDRINSIEDLPRGWNDEQAPGKYRLDQLNDGLYFGYVVGANSLKNFLFPSKLKLFATRKNGTGFTIQPEDHVPPSYAFIGVRACDLAAVAVQDKIFCEAKIKQPHYTTLREKAFILAVNCTRPGGTCFCVSMETGPRCEGGFDLALTELEDNFLVEVGSPLGAHMLEETEWRLAGARDINRAAKLMNDARNQMGRQMDCSDLPDLLLERLDHPRWDEVGRRCLSCANCTLVCPTCFCCEVQDISDLEGVQTERIRVWDSCFNPDFSYIHGGHVRPNVRSRYRQWLTHKLASWIGQFGSSGCVGCGRCITWCPVGIDLTEELSAIRGEVVR